MKLRKAVDLPQRISDDPWFLFRPHKDEAKNSREHTKCGASMRGEEEEKAKQQRDEFD